MENALNEAKCVILRKKVIQGAMVGVMALAGCTMPVTAIPTSTTSFEANTLNITEGVPAITETLAPTTEPTQTVTATPMETAVPEIFSKLTSEEFLAKSDEELRNIAPVPDIEALGFPEGTQLTPDVIIRGGEGANYVLYKRGESGLQELAWNAETGAIEHAVYGKAKTYKILDRETVQEVEVEGIPILFLTSPKVLETDGGWFGPNPDPRFYNPEQNSERLNNPQEMLGEAFMQALGVWYWGRYLHPGERIPSQYDQAKSLAEIPPLDNFNPVEYTGYYSTYSPINLNRHQIALLGKYWRDLFLLDLEKKRQSNQQLEIELKNKGDDNVDLTKTDVFIVRFDMIEYHEQAINHWIDWALQIETVSDSNTLRFIEGNVSPNAITLVVDQPAYTIGRVNRHVPFFGGYVSFFLRYFFGYKWVEYTSNVAGALCPDWSLPPDNLYSSQNPIPMYLGGVQNPLDPYADRCAIQWINKHL
jgi:hypothetical protein